MPSWEGRGFVLREASSIQEEKHLPLPAWMEDGRYKREGEGRNMVKLLPYHSG